MSRRAQRFQRNAEFALRAPLPPANLAESWSLSELTVIGIVCNPKTHAPCLAVTDGEYVSLRGLHGSDPLRRLGRGYYEETSNEPARIVDLPRAHCPDGVVVKGAGWGTVLYTALCLGAHVVEADLVEISMWKKGEGICSWTDNRSAEADRWWEAAVKKKLALREVEEESETEEGVDLDREVPTSALDPFVDEGEVTYINTINVDIEKTKEVSVEYLPFDNVSSSHAHLVAAVMNVEVPKGLNAAQSLAFLWKAIRDDSDLVVEADPYALLALDVRELDRDALNLLAICYPEAGLDEAALDELQLRYARGLDPGISSRQGRLFTPNQAGLNDVRLAREAAGWEALADLP